MKTKRLSITHPAFLTTKTQIAKVGIEDTVQDDSFLNRAGYFVSENEQTVFNRIDYLGFRLRLREHRYQAKYDVTVPMNEDSLAKLIDICRQEGYNTFLEEDGFPEDDEDGR